MSTSPTATGIDGIPTTSTVVVIHEAIPFLRFFLLAALFFSGLLIIWDVPAFAAVQCTLIIAALFAWWLWSKAVSTGVRLRHRSALLVVVLFVNSALSNGVAGILFIWVAAAVLYFLLSNRTYIVLCAALPVVFVSVAHAIKGSDLYQILIETAFAITAIGTSVALGSFLRRYAETAAEQQHTMEQLKLANEQLRDLTLAQERSRIAAALHDALGHRLTSINMSLVFAQRAWNSAPERALEEVSHAQESVVDALDEMRTVVRALNPVRVESNSFVEALQSVGDSFASTGLDVQVRTPSELDIDHSAERVLLAATQEALTNAVRHSGADRVDIVLTSNGTLLIADNGSGNSASDLGFGLRSLRERAESIGGSMELSDHGGIDQGFLLRVSVPVGAAA